MTHEQGHGVGMTREIKFRAWIGKECKRGYTTEVMLDDEQVKSEIVSDMKFPSLFWSGNGIYPMQFTGLHDKNGKEIYEGDIVTYDIKTPWDENQSVRVKSRVEWAEDGQWWLYCPSGSDGCGPIGFFGPLQLIGNIYENLNLLNPPKQ